jgi:hypothetical protein
MKNILEDILLITGKHLNKILGFISLFLAILLGENVWLAIGLAFFILDAVDEVKAKLSILELEKIKREL